MVFIKSGEIINPYQKKAIFCSMVFIKSGEIINPYQKKAIVCSMVFINPYKKKNTWDRLFHEASLDSRDPRESLPPWFGLSLAS